MSEPTTKRRPRRIAVLLCAAVSAATTLNGSTPLQMQVSPVVSRAPAQLTVRVRIEAAADNRALHIVAESADFYRSSEIQLDGRNAAPLNLFEFRDVPPGFYEVTGVLIGVNGPRASASGLAKVEPAVGQAR